MRPGAAELPSETTVVVVPPAIGTFMIEAEEPFHVPQ
jgi:hypothetical protein